MKKKLNQIKKAIKAPMADEDRKIKFRDAAVEKIFEQLNINIEEKDEFDNIDKKVIEK